jgi:hypothetical protein
MLPALYAALQRVARHCSGFVAVSGVCPVNPFQLALHQHYPSEQRTVCRRHMAEMPQAAGDRLPCHFIHVVNKGEAQAAGNQPHSDFIHYVNEGGPPQAAGIAEGHAARLDVADPVVTAQIRCTNQLVSGFVQKPKNARISRFSTHARCLTACLWQTLYSRRRSLAKQRQAAGNRPIHYVNEAR